MPGYNHAESKRVAAFSSDPRANNCPSLRFMTPPEELRLFIFSSFEGSSQPLARLSFLPLSSYHLYNRIIKMVLKGISPLISPTLLKILAEMGHGDEIVLADAHFPSHSICPPHISVVRADGTFTPSNPWPQVHLHP